METEPGLANCNYLTGALSKSLKKTKMAMSGSGTQRSGVPHPSPPALWWLNISTENDSCKEAREWEVRSQTKAGIVCPRDGVSRWEDTNQGSLPQP